MPAGKRLWVVVVHGKRETYRYVADSAHVAWSILYTYVADRWIDERYENGHELGPEEQIDAYFNDTAHSEWYAIEDCWLQTELDLWVGKGRHEVI